MRNLEKNSSDTLESRNLVFYFLSGQLNGLNNIPSSGGEKTVTYRPYSTSTGFCLSGTGILE